MGFPSLNLFSLQARVNIEPTTFRCPEPEKRNCAIWLNGLDHAEKHLLCKNLQAVLGDTYGISAVAIDGDNLSEELCAELGYCHTDYKNNVRQVAEVAKLIMDSGVFTIISSKAPLAECRQTARQLLAASHVIDVLIEAPQSKREANNIQHIHQNKYAERGKKNQGMPGAAIDEAEFQLQTPYLGIHHSTKTIVRYLEENLLI